MNRRGIACWVGVAAILAGCAGAPVSPQETGLGSPASASPSLQALKVEPQFQNQEARGQLEELGLAQPFDEYWAAFVARDWAGRYRMEEFHRPVEEQFYVSYHAAAWRLLELHIDAIDAADAPERVRINLRARFRNLERPEQEANTVLQDLWTKRGQGWLHVNSDPMLNGLRSVK